MILRVAGFAVDVVLMKSCILVTYIKQNGRFWNFIEPMKAMRSMKSDIAFKIHRISKNFQTKIKIISKTKKNKLPCKK